MKITTKSLKYLNPCKDRLDNYLNHYSGKEFTPGEFMELENITFTDKVWVAVRLIDKSKLRFAAADIAESVLPLFEAKYPNDLRPRRAIEAARGNDFTSATANAYACAAHAAKAAAAYAADVVAYNVIAYAADAAEAADTGTAADCVAHAAEAAYATGAVTHADNVVAKAAAAYAAEAAYAADDVAHATGAVTHADDVVAYANAAYAVDKDREKQEKLIIEILLKYIKG